MLIHSYIYIAKCRDIFHQFNTRFFLLFFGLALFCDRKKKSAVFHVHRRDNKTKQQYKMYTIHWKRLNKITGTSEKNVSPR